MKKILLIFAIVLCAAGISLADGGGFDPAKLQRPDLEKIQAKTTDETSKYYYPKLLTKFFANDTAMTVEEFQYFYYGALFQEDYDPYRPQYKPEELQRLEPLYYKDTHTRAENEEMIAYAKAALADNPLDLLQLKYLVYAYEHNRKDILARIWKYKLNHLLWAIAASGTGVDKDNAWIVVYPRHEFDFLNLSGLAVQSREFEEPYYEKVFVKRHAPRDPEYYYFNIQPILEQYYIKHPTER